MKRSMLFLLVLTVGCGAVEGTEGPDTNARIAMNESLALSRLSTLVTAQAQAQCLGVIDADGDEIGEYAFICELSGGRPPRAGGMGLKVALLGKDFRSLSSDRFVATQGYYYRVFLPGADGKWVGESRGAGKHVDSEMAEQAWVCCVWPSRYGATGKRAFAVCQTGRILINDKDQFSGPNGPDADAVFGAPGNTDAAEGWQPLR